MGEVEGADSFEGHEEFGGEDVGGEFALAAGIVGDAKAEYFFCLFLEDGAEYFFAHV